MNSEKRQTNSNQYTRGADERSMQLNKKASKQVGMGKRTLSLLMSGAAVVGCLAFSFFITKQQSSKVLVTVATQAIGQGTLINETMLDSKEMDLIDYESFGTRNTEENGEKKSENVYVLWEDKDLLLNKYSQMYIRQDQILTKEDITDEVLVRSPWISKVESGKEIYTLKFAADDIYSPIFFPGSHVRVRMIYSVPSENVLEIKQRISEKEKRKESGQYISGDGESIIMDALQNNEFSGNIGFGENEKSTVPVSEIVFEDMVVVDMLNGSRSSIFDLYYELLSMPVDKRIEYLKTTIEDEGQQSFKSKVQPTYITLVTTKEESTMLSEFELLDAEKKYTLLVTDTEEYNLMKQFTEMGTQIQSFLDNTNVSSFD